MAEFTRITRDPKVMGGKACIRGMRVTVGMIVGQIGGGATIEELLKDFPYLERDDITEAIRYAAWLASEREVDLTPGCMKIVIDMNLSPLRAYGTKCYSVETGPAYSVEIRRICTGGHQRVQRKLGNRRVAYHQKRFRMRILPIRESN